MRVEKSFEAMVVVGISGVAVVSCTEKPAEPAGAVESQITIDGAWEWVENIGFDTPSPGVFKITGVVTLSDDDAVYSDVNIENLAGSCYDFKPLNVIAGKFDGDNYYNCKVADDAHTLSEAIAKSDQLACYPWSFIQHKGRYLTVLAEGFTPFD